MKKWRVSSASRITLYYLIIGGLWILLSDKLVALLFADPVKLSLAQTYKGWTYITITSLLLFRLIKNNTASQAAAEKNYFDLFENSGEGIFQSSPEGRFILVNPAMARMYGYSSPQEMIEFVTDISAQIHLSPQSRRYFTEAFHKSDSGQKFEAQNFRKDGTIMWTSTNARAVKNKDGKVLYYEGFVRDVTERKLNESALRDAEKRYRLLVEKLPAAVFIYNYDDPTSTLYISPYIQDLLGYTPEEWTASKNQWENSLHAADKDRVLAEDVRTNNTGEPFRIEYRMRHRDGHYVSIKEEASLIKNDEGETLYWQGILLDITDRMHTEDALQRQLKELTILHSVALAESSARSVDELIQRVTDIIGDTLYTDNCGVLLLNAKKDSLQPHRSYRGTKEENLATNLPLTRGISGKVVMAREAMRIGDVTLEPDYFEAKEGVRSELCVPILSGDKIFGVLNVENNQVNAFTADDETLLSTIAGGLATAIERLHLFDLEQRRHKKTEILREATAALTASIDIEVLYQIILDSIAKLVDYTSASIESINLDYVEIVAQRGLPDRNKFIGMRYPYDSGKLTVELWTPVIIADVQRDDRFTKFLGTEYIRGWLGIPLIAEGKRIGFLNLDSDKPDFFNEDDAALVQTFANQAAVAIEKARLFQAEQKRRQEAENLRLAAAAMTSSLDPKYILKEIITALKRVAPYDSASIFLLEGDSLRLTIAEDYADAENMTNLIFPSADDELFQESKRTGRPLILDDAQKDPRFKKWGNTSYIHGWMAVPLITRGEVIGAITLDSLEVGTYDESIGEQAMSFAHQAAIAIDNARLYTETRQRLEELEVVSRVSFALRAARDTREMFPILLNEIKTNIDTDTAAIWIYDAEKNDLIPQATSGWLARLPKPNFKPGEGIVGKVFTNGVMYLSNEFLNDPQAHSENAQTLGKDCGGITVPLRTASDTIGVMTIAVQHPRQIEAHHVRLVTTIAEIAGNAIYRSNLSERSEEQIRRLTALREMDTAITSSLDLRVTLGILSDHLTSRMGVSAAATLGVKPESQMLDYYAATGFQNREIPRTSLGIGDGFAGQILVNRRAILIKDLQLESKAQRTGLLVEKFSSYYAMPLFSKGATRGILETYFRDPFTPTDDWLDFLHTLAGQATIAIDNAHLFENLQRTNQELSLAYDTTLEGWGKALELRDEETQGHTRRVTNLTLDLARQMNIPESELTSIRRGALLHDIGKMGVPDSILHKEGPLTRKELVEMRKHPQYAYDLLYPITYLRPAIDIAYCHHEWWDGSGYPRGIKGEDIPLAARIFAVVDVWDALLSDRPYRKAWTHKKSLEYIYHLSGKQFDT